jgi:Ni/Fe-hydrogenase subunit HybB-like protein
MDARHLRDAAKIVLGFGKAASIVLMGYFFIKLFGLAMDNNWKYLFSGYGVWYLVEMFGFVLLPSFMYAIGAREKKTGIIRLAAVITVIGVVINRFNVSLVAFNWQLPAAEKYFPSWMEIAISVFIVTLIVTAYRFICHYMPVLREHPDYEAH